MLLPPVKPQDAPRKPVRAPSSTEMMSHLQQSNLSRTRSGLNDSEAHQMSHSLGARPVGSCTPAFLSSSALGVGQILAAVHL